MSKTETPPAPAAAATTARRSTLHLALLVGVVVAAAGGGGYWWARQQQPLAAAAVETTAPAKDPRRGSLLPLDTFTVNLADPGASRFLRVTVQLVLAEKDAAAEIEHDPLLKTRVRSAVLELLTTQQSQVLVTPEGKATLKDEIAARVTEAAHVEVSDVLFSDFVVQF
jgi:flagellar FliL protein